MRPYEILFVLKPDLEEEAINAAIERFTGLIQQNGGQVEQVSRWGKKRMAYEIENYRDGYYTLILFQSEPDTARELNRVMRLTDEILRHLIVRREAA